jgi:hypothetical protein
VSARRLARRSHLEAKPLPPIELRREQNQIRSGARYGLMFLVFLRLVAALWLIQGLLHWLDILMPASSAPTAFDHLSRRAAFATAVFAVLDPIAAVGLWLAVPWGAVIWIITLIAQIGVIFVIPGFFANGAPRILMNLILLVAYFALLWRVAHVNDEETAG